MTVSYRIVPLPRERSAPYERYEVSTSGSSRDKDVGQQKTQFA